MTTVPANDELVSRLTSNDETIWPVSVKQVKVNAQIPHADDDLLLNDQIIPSAVAFIENLGRVSLITQTRKVTHDCEFPKEFETRWPLQSVTSITYLDSNYASQTVAASYYRALTAGKPGRIRAKSGITWPSPVDDKEVVIATYKSGFGDAASSVPPEWKHPIVLLASYWWENRLSYDAQFVAQAFLDTLVKLVDVAGRLVRYA